MGPSFAQRPYFLGGAMLWMAHRGGAGEAPENTLAAFQHAIDLGFSHIESDIHLSADGHLMVFHDATLDRTTDGTGPISKRTLAELKGLDAAFHFNPAESADPGVAHEHPERGQGHQIPTFAEAIDLNADVKFNIETKGKDPALVDRFWNFINTHGLHDRVLVAAADDAMGKRFRKLCRGTVATSAGKRGAAAFLGASRLGLHKRKAWAFDALQVPIRLGPIRVVTRPFVRAAHACGLAVHCWTIDDPAEMRWLQAVGVDGIMTDRPSLMAGALAPVEVPWAGLPSAGAPRP